MLTVMARSNIYQEAAQMFEDLVAYGTAPQIIYEKKKSQILIPEGPGMQKALQAMSGENALNRAQQGQQFLIGGRGLAGGVEDGPAKGGGQRLHDAQVAFIRVAQHFQGKRNRHCGRRQTGNRNDCKRQGRQDFRLRLN